MITVQTSKLRRTLAPADLRTEFALRLASLYGTEVPAYNTLVDVSREVNQSFIAAHRADAERLGSIDRVTAERHGAIRVGSPRELAEAARVFAGFGMYPAGRRPDAAVRDPAEPLSGGGRAPARPGRDHHRLTIYPTRFRQDRSPRMHP